MSLLHAIETCLRTCQLPPSRFGRNAVRDPRLVHDLRRGRQPGPVMERRVMAYIDQLSPRAGTAGSADDGIGAQS
jgi:hypothetical protein